MNPADVLSRHEHALRSFFEEADVPARRLKEAIGHALFPGGKHIRPLLVYLCGELLKVPLEALDAMAVAIELVHCYSLVHDDLPAMDNDDFRRGLPSCHRAFDEATAILAGDALQNMAFDHLLTKLPPLLNSEKAVTVCLTLLKACGPQGMISGQSLDLSELGGTDVDETRLNLIHTLKTGKMFQACAAMAISAGSPSEEEARALEAFSEHLGLVFQMQDDYLDAWPSTCDLGKNRASDADNQKTTFAGLYGRAELLERINQQFEKATGALALFGRDAEPLVNIIRQIQERSTGKPSENPDNT